MLRTIAFIAAMTLATAAFAVDGAGTLGQSSGKVMVVRNGQYVQVQAGDTLMAGDQIMVAAGGSANFQFGDGCSMPVSGGTIVTIPSSSTCAGGVAETKSLNASQNAAFGASGFQMDWVVFSALGGGFAAYAVSENQGQKTSP